VTQRSLLGRHKTSHHPLAGTSATLFSRWVTQNAFFQLSVSLSLPVLSLVFLDREIFGVRLPLMVYLLCA